MSQVEEVIRGIYEAINTGNLALLEATVVACHMNLGSSVGLASMTVVGALQPVADHAAYGRRCPIPAIRLGWCRSCP